MRSSPKENQSLEVKVKGISEMEFSLSIFDYTFTNYLQWFAQGLLRILTRTFSPFCKGLLLLTTKRSPGSSPVIIST
ncbi:MAG: hypothetical protein EWV84_03555 [Microcystis sp. M_QC_C_20170808_M3Col]|nr:MAG: hypothetical protein EWV84_03555 [Microcystis sp. M_QC_C_20170808_M3Col]